MRQGVVGVRDGQPHLLQPARHPDRPGPVAEVPLDLPDDRRQGIAHEVDAEAGIESVDRFDQTHRRGLEQVVDGLTTIGVAMGEMPGQRQPRLDSPLPRRRPGRMPGRQGRHDGDEIGSVGCGSRSRPLAFGRGSGRSGCRTHGAPLLISRGFPMFPTP
jgi:hypothetical protein